MNFASVTKLLQEVVEELAKPDEEVRVRPSTLGNCPRQVYFSVLQKVDPEVIENSVDEWGMGGDVVKGFFVSGKIHEEMIRPKMEAAGFHYQCYIVVTPDEDPPLWGHCDFYKYDPDTEECFIVDIKTTSIKSKPYLPKQTHIAQVTLYLHGALHGEVWRCDEQGNPVEKFPQAKVGHGCIFYIIRENPAHLFDGQEYWFDYDEDEAQALLAYKRYLDTAIRTRKEPPIPPSYSPFSFPCMYVSEFSYRSVMCPFWRLCWKDTIERRTRDGDEQLQKLGEELIKLYVAKEKITEEYEAKVALLKSTLSEIPHITIYTPLGEIRKSTYSRRYVKWKEVVNALVEEGLVSSESVEKLIPRAEVVDDVVTLRIKPTISDLTSPLPLNNEKEENGVSSDSSE